MFRFLRKTRPKNRAALGFFVGIIIAANFLVFVPQARAGILDGFFIGFFQGLFGWIIGLEGWFLATLTNILLGIMAYNGFVSAYAVQIGWTLVRDVANLFFVVILLAIAIGTILRIESYNFKRLLPKLLIMAILVNFSRLICGLMIDFAQVVMMTFAVAFAHIGSSASGGERGSNVLKLLNIDNIMSSRAEQAGEGDTTEDSLTISTVIMTGLLAVVLLLVAIVVLLVMTAVIIMRIIMLWLLVVLSPLPFILSAFPQGQRYSQQWWQEFSKYVIIGPILAFFLWLSFAVANQGDGTGGETGRIVLNDEAVSREIETQGTGNKDITRSAGENVASSEAIFSAIGDSSQLLSMILGIGMLLGSLMLTQQMGVAGGQLAGAAYGRIRSMGTAPLRAAGNLLARGAKGGLGTGARFAGRRLDDWVVGGTTGFLAKQIGKTQWGRDRGFDVLGREGGVRLRALPQAWGAYRKRVEDEQMRRAPEAMTDVLNRSMPWKRTKTDLARQERQQNIREEQRRIADTSTDADEILARLREEDLDESGKVRKGREDYAIAKLRQLTTDHNANELVLQAQDVFGPAFGAGLAGTNRELDTTVDGKLDYTVHNTQEIIRHMFDGFGEDFQGEVMFDMGELGFANKDAILYKMGRKNLDTGRFEIMTRDKKDADGVSRYEKQADIAERYSQKQEGRAFIRQSTWQNFLKEARVENTSGSAQIIATGMQDFGRMSLNRNPKALVAEYHQASNEIKRRILENLDVMHGEAEKSRAAGKDDEANAIERLIESAVGFEEHGRTGAENPERAFGNRADLQAAVQAHIQRARDEKVASFGSAKYDEMMRNAGLAAIPGPAGPAAAPPPVPGGGPMPLAMNPQAYQKTLALRERAKEIGGTELDYTAMPEYNEEEYLNPEEMENYEKIMAKKERMQEMGAQAFNVSQLAQLSSKDPSELASSRVMVDLDLSRLQDLDFVNPNARELTWGDLSGDQGEELAVRLLEELEKEKQKIMEEGSHKYDPEKKKRLADINQTLGPNSVLASPEKLAQIGSFQINNTAGGNEAIIHGMGHQDLTTLDPTGGMQMQWWDDLSEEEKSRRQKKIERESGRKFNTSKSGDRIALAQENAAIMYANETDFGDKSSGAARFTSSQKRQLKSAAEQADYSLGIHIPVEVEVEPELEEIPSEFRATVSHWAEKFRRKKPAKGVKPSAELTEEDKFGIRQKGHQETIDSRQKRQQQLDQMASSSKALVGSNSDEYETAAAERALAESRLASISGEQQRKKGRINELSQQAKDAEARGDIPAAKQARAQAKLLREEYDKGQENQAQAKKQVADKKKAEGKAKKNLTDQIKTYEEHQETADRNQKVIAATKKVKKAEAGLEMVRTGKLPEAWDPVRRAAFQKSMNEALQRAQREIESLTFTPPAPTSEAMEAVTTARTAASKDEINKAASSVSPEDFAAAVEQSFGDIGQDLMSAIRRGTADDNTAVVQSLGELQNVLETLSSSFKGISPAQLGKPRDDLAKYLGRIRQAQGTVRSGGELDPGSVTGLLTGISQTLKLINRNLAKSGRNKGPKPVVPPRQPKTPPRK